MTSRSVEENVRRASKSLEVWVCNLSILLATSIIETCHLWFQNWIVSEKGLDQLAIIEELREFEVAKIYCSATTLLEFSAISYKTLFFF